MMDCPHYESDEIMAGLGRAVVDMLIGLVGKGRDDELRDTRGAASHIVAEVRRYTSTPLYAPGDSTSMTCRGG